MFRREPFSSREKKLSENINKLGLTNFNVKKKKSPAAKKSDSIIFQKVLGASQRPIDIVRARDTLTQEILTYDLIETSTIFKEDLLTKPDKASLVKESEKNLSSTHYNFNSISSQYFNHI